MQRIEHARWILNIVAGWSMPTLSFLEAIGMRDPFKGFSRPDLALRETLVMLALLSILMILVRRGERPRVVAIVSLLLPSLLFVYFALTVPDSYRQWKAMAFAAPFAVVAVGAALCLFAGTFRSSFLARQVARVSLVVVVALWMAVAFSGRFDPTGDIKHCTWSDCPIGTVVRGQFDRYEQDASSEQIAIARGPFWPSMAAAYFLWGRPVALRDPTYWGSSGNPVQRTLGPNGWEINPG